MSAKCDIEQQPLLIDANKAAFSIKRALLRPVYHLPVVKYLSYRCDKYIAGFRRSRILFDWQSDKPTQPNICVFAHYDADGEAKPYVLHYLQQLVDNKFTIVFVTSASLSASAQRLLQPLCQRIVVRNNCGRDFMSYKVGLQLIENLSDYKQLLITNDSFFVSEQAIKRALLVAQRSDIDMCSLTDCEEYHYHLQSFFLLVKPKVFLHKSFNAFWRHVKPLLSKSNIVQFYEIGLSRQLQKAGFNLKALCPVARMKRDLASNSFTLPSPVQQQLAEWLENKLNPSFYCWWLLIKYYQCPMIKRDLLQRNPMGMNLTQWQQLFKDCTDYPVDLIEQAVEGKAK